LGNQNPPRTGNRHGGMAESPYNVYPAADGWLALICVSDAHFVALAEAMGRSDLPGDSRFSSLKSRVAHMDDLDIEISAWSRLHTKEDLSKILGAHRVPCAPVREIDEVVNDPHMHQRGTLRRVDHPDMGEVVLPTGPLRYDDAPLGELVPSKDIGADNAAVYCGWLGMSRGEFDELVAEGAV
jgi:crotonobetainyl-CoA:carnitine CoA-transferase CaiB-like acyl-CoA transferase